MKTKLSVPARLIACCVVGSVGGNSAVAQNNELSLLELEEVVVTAQRREQRILDIPFSISAISGDTLDQKGITGVDDLAAYTPALTFGASASSRGEGLQIRGIGTTNFADGIEGAVGTVIDGVVVGRQSAALNDLFDIERIEVLRGPQGTLFGKNTSAGLINIITKKPTQESEFIARASYGTFDTAKLNAVISGAIADDKLLGRLSVYTQSRDGTVDQVNPNLDQSELNDKQETALRAKLLFDVNSDLEIYMIGEYSQEDQDCCVWTERVLSDPNSPSDLYGLNNFQVSALSGLLQAGPENRKVAPSSPAGQESTSGAFSVQVDYSLSDKASLRSISAWRKFDTEEYNDPDGTPLAIFDYAGTESDVTQLSQEIQLLMTPMDDLEFVVGALFFDQSIDSSSRFAGTLAYSPELIETFSDQTTDIRNIGLFGQVTYQFSDRWALTGGTRIVREDIDITFKRNAGAYTFPVSDPTSEPFVLRLPGPLGVDAQLTAKESDTAYTGMVSLQYFINDATTAYGTISNGYKGRGLAVNAKDVTILEPEVPVNVEAGIRSRFFDRRVFTSLSLFRTHYQDFQSSVIELSGVSTVNVDSVVSRGAEFEFSVTPTENFLVSGGVAYIDARIDEYPTLNACYTGQTEAQGCLLLDDGSYGQSIEGNVMPNSPKWSASMNLNWNFYTGNEFQAYINTGYSWRSKVIFDLLGDPNTRQDAYGLLDSRLGFRNTKHGYEIAVWGKNLTDENYALGIFENFIFGSGYSQFLGLERQVGVEFLWEY